MGTSRGTIGKSLVNQYSNSFAVKSSNTHTNGNYFSNELNTTHQALNISFKIEQEIKTEDEKGVLNHHDV